MAAEPVSVVITRVVRGGREEAFERAVREWIPLALRHPGHQGVFMLRPPPGGREYGAVLRFESRGHWEAFRDAAEYRAFLDALREHIEGEPRVETASGLEAWLARPGAGLVRVPPRWKTAVVTWLGVDLTALVLAYTLTPLTAGWPWALAFVTFNAGVVGGLTWLTMPALSRLFGGWLHADPAHPAHPDTSPGSERPPP